MKPLTARQHQIIRLTCVEGMSRSEAAHAMGISEMTVKNHITPLLKNLDEQSMNRVCFRYGCGEFTDPKTAEPIENVCPECNQPEDNHCGDCLTIN